jgi:hypothetical protein
LRLLQPLTVGGPDSLQLHELPARTESVIRRALHGVRLRLLTVPRSMPEPQIEDFLVRTVARRPDRSLR